MTLNDDLDELCKLADNIKVLRWSDVAIQKTSHKRREVTLSDQYFNIYRYDKINDIYFVMSENMLLKDICDTYLIRMDNALSAIAQNRLVHRTYKLLPVDQKVKEFIENRYDITVYINPAKIKKN